MRNVIITLKKSVLVIIASFGFHNSYADIISKLPPPGECPQPRFTGKAPASIYKLKNPLKLNKNHLKEGKKIYQSKAKPLPCRKCHGRKGDGKGGLASTFNPPPRNFACAETVNGIPDGQLFWIIKNGSPGTGMIDYRSLSSIQIWKVVLYIRQLANRKD